MSIIFMLLAGLIVGVIAGKIMDTKLSTVWTIVLGIAGSAFGEFIFGLLGFYTTGLASLVADVIGACLVIAIARKISGNR